MYKIVYNGRMKVGVFCNSQTKKYQPIRDGLLKTFKARGIAFETYFAPEEIASPDVLIVLGGDGTILKAAIEAGKRGIDLLGINSGNLGFLTEFEGEQIEKAVDLIVGKYEAEERSVLCVRAGGKEFFALNEAVFQRRYREGADDNVVEISAFIDGKKSGRVCRRRHYREHADGFHRVFAFGGRADFDARYPRLYPDADLRAFPAQQADRLFGRECDEGRSFRSEKRSFSFFVTGDSAARSARRILSA